MEADVKNLKDNPQTTLLEGLHSVAYSGGLGRPLIVPEGMLGGLTAGGWAAVLPAVLTASCGRQRASGCAGREAGRRAAGWTTQHRYSSTTVPLPSPPHPSSPPDVAAEFYAANYTAPRMVLAGAGVDHDELVRWACCRAVHCWARCTMSCCTRLHAGGLGGRVQDTVIRCCCSLRLPASDVHPLVHSAPPPNPNPNPNPQPPTPNPPPNPTQPTHPHSCHSGPPGRAAAGRCPLRRRLRRVQLCLCGRRLAAVLRQPPDPCHPGI